MAVCVVCRRDCFSLFSSFINAKDKQCCKECAMKALSDQYKKGDGVKVARKYVKSGTVEALQRELERESKRRERPQGRPQKIRRSMRRNALLPSTRICPKCFRVVVNSRRWVVLSNVVCCLKCYRVDRSKV